MSGDLIIYGVLVFLIAMVAGYISIRSVQIGKANLTFFLTFSGAYLFSITIIHLLPEVFEHGGHGSMTGVYVLAGFFIQQILEFFSSGVEHGHMHEHHGEHQHSKWFTINVLLALCIHSVLEGTLLTDKHGESIFFGILIHKAPAAFALVSVLMCHIKSIKKVFLYLTIFALASPFGMIISEVFAKPEMQTVVFAIVAGSFLQISTTIVFETSADHKFNIRKLIFSFAGAVVAVLSELYLL